MTASPAIHSSGSPLTLHPDRFFDAEATVRRVARELYEETHPLPLICPHGHVDPWLLAHNAPFPEPTALLITPDHYLVRMLYSQGVPMESLGIPTRDGTAVERDPRVIWRRFAAHFHLFTGTPSGVWLTHELHELFGVREKLSAESADRVYDQIQECLRAPEFLPRTLFERFRIEVLATTDAATDPLLAHQQIRASGWTGRVVPTFRPDAVFRIASPQWRAEISTLTQQHNASIKTFAGFIQALESRRRFFRNLGATATDHGVVEPYTQALPADALDAIFARAIAGTATAADQRAFEGHMLIEMARMSTDDGMVMQLHAGALRDHHEHVFQRFGADRGADIPLATEFTRNLRPLLNAYGHDTRLTLILFTLDESTYARELAPLAGHYPAVRLGPPWWFHDSIEGMRRFREQVTETAGFWNTAGFNDDTRAFCSIPARHDLARRMDANFLGRLVARHVIDMSDARHLARLLAYDLARDAYRFGHAGGAA